MIQKLTAVFFLLLIFCLNTFAQKKIEGKFYLKTPKSIIDQYQKFDFSKDGTFQYESGGDLGPETFGHGKYQLSKEKLTLNYSPHKDSIRSEIYTNSLEIKTAPDLVEFQFEFYDLENKMPIPATVFKFFEDKSKNKFFQSNQNGICNLTLPKGEENQTYTISFLGYEKIELDLKNDTSKKVKVGLAYSLGTQIIDKSIEYSLEKTSKNSIDFTSGSKLVRIKD